MNQAEQGKVAPAIRPSPWRTPRRAGTGATLRAIAAERGPLNLKTARSPPPGALDTATIVVGFVYLLNAFRRSLAVSSRPSNRTARPNSFSLSQNRTTLQRARKGFALGEVISTSSLNRSL